MGCWEVLRAEGCSNKGGERSRKGENGDMGVEKVSEACMPFSHTAKVAHPPSLEALPDDWP